MSTDEERAALLRVIARGGYSPLLDQDGSTANTLYDMAETLAPMSAPPRKANPLRRWWLRSRFRRRARALGLIP